MDNPEMDNPKVRNVITEILGQGHVLKYTLSFIRRWRADPNFNPDDEIQRAEEAVKEYHRRLVAALEEPAARRPAMGAAEMRERLRRIQSRISYDIKDDLTRTCAIDEVQAILAALPKEE